MKDVGFWIRDGKTRQYTVNKLNKPFKERVWGSSQSRKLLKVSI